MTHKFIFSRPQASARRRAPKTIRKGSYSSLFLTQSNVRTKITISSYLLLLVYNPPYRLHPPSHTQVQVSELVYLESQLSPQDQHLLLQTCRQ